MGLAEVDEVVLAAENLENLSIQSVKCIFGSPS